MRLDGVSYEAVSYRAVRVRGSRFEPAPYTVKLEGAGLVGYRAAVLGGVTDPAILADFDDWFAAASAGAEANARRALGDELADQCTVYYSFYGKNAVLGALETRKVDEPIEIGVLINVLAPTRELAHSMVATVSHTILHSPVPRWHGLVSNLAFPTAPHEIDFGPAYSFVLNHVVELDRSARALRDRTAGGVTDGNPGIARQTHPKQERRTVDAHDRRHVPRCADLSSRRRSRRHHP